MKVYAPKDFQKEAVKNNVDEEDLCAAIKRAEDGLIEANLGKFLIKQRVAREGQGKSKGFRVIVFYKNSTIAVFLHLFAKNNQDNLTDDELVAFKEFVDVLDKMSDEQRDNAVLRKKWIEIDYERHQEELSKRSASVDSPGGERPPRGRRGR